MLSRPQLCGRISTLRSALDILCAQADVDGHGSFACRGSMKVELIALEAKLRTMATPDELPVIRYAERDGRRLPYLERRGQ